MKSIIASLIVILVLASCGKYEKPFITFKSPEKRLINKTWKLIKKVHSTGFEESPNESIAFNIDSDSTALINGTISASWTWMGTIEKDKFDKERIKVIDPIYNRTYKIKVLTSKKLQLYDLASLIEYYYESN
ncbi:MAG: hypothetical protein ACKO7P_06915 [Bacteroidota bacterium]